MLFNSFGFLLGFLPVTVIGFLPLARRSEIGAAARLAGASIFFGSRERQECAKAQPELFLDAASIVKTARRSRR